MSSRRNFKERAAVLVSIVHPLLSPAAAAVVLSNISAKGHFIELVLY
jgi:hypothetical protein